VVSSAPGYRNELLADGPSRRSAGLENVDELVGVADE